MGGVLILIGLFSAVLLWCNLSNPYIWTLIFVVSGFGLLGAYDDYKKIKFNNSTGVSFNFKIIIQVLIAVIATFMLIKFSDHSDLEYLYFPFFKNLLINLGWFFIPFAAFIIVGSSNAILFFQNIFKFRILKELVKLLFFWDQ